MIKPPSEVPAGRPEPVLVVSSLACPRWRCSTAILEKAGPDLNYGTFQQAGYSLGAIVLPICPDPWTFGAAAARRRRPGRLRLRLGPGDQAVPSAATADAGRDRWLTQNPNAAALAGTILDLEAERHDRGRRRVELARRRAARRRRRRAHAAARRCRSAARFTFGLIAAARRARRARVVRAQHPGPRHPPDARASAPALMVFISAASGAFLVLGSVPMGWLADRYRRGPIIAWASLVFSLMVLLSGLASTRPSRCSSPGSGSGVAKSNQLPGAGVAARRPVPDRRPAAASAPSISIAGRIAGTLSPLLVGGIAVLAGGSAGWRWAFIILSIPVGGRRLVAVPAARAAARAVREAGRARRGRSRTRSPRPISMEAAFSRLMQIRTIRATVIAFAAMGFGLFTVPGAGQLLPRGRSTASARSAGALSATVGGIAVLVTLPFVGRYYDRLYRRDPPEALRLLGLVVLPAALLTPLQYFMPNRGAVRHPRHPRQRCCCRRRSPWSGRSLTSVVPVPAAGDGRGARRDLRLLRRRHRRRAARRACSSTPTARGSRCSSSSCRPRSSAAC